MRKILCFLFLCSSIFATYEEDEVPVTEFSIHQDPCMRIFYIKNKDAVLGTVLSSGHGRFDFYDKEKKMQWFNLFDALFDNSGIKIGNLLWERDPEIDKWFWNRERFLYRRMSYIKIYTGDHRELLATFHPYRQGNEALFVFCDGETKQLLAVAYWSWTHNEWLAPQLQNWQVYIMDRPRLQERRISDIFLTWTLLKHSQNYFPFGAYQYDYIKNLP